MSNYYARRREDFSVMKIPGTNIYVDIKDHRFVSDASIGNDIFSECLGVEELKIVENYCKTNRLLYLPERICSAYIYDFEDEDEYEETGIPEYLRNYQHASFPKRNPECTSIFNDINLLLNLVNESTADIYHFNSIEDMEGLDDHLENLEEAISFIEKKEEFKRDDAVLSGRMIREEMLVRVLIYIRELLTGMVALDIDIDYFCQCIYCTKDEFLQWFVSSMDDKDYFFILDLTEELYKILVSGKKFYEV